MPVVLCGVTLGFGVLAVALGEMRLVQVTLMPNRIFGGIIENPVLVAAPMFIFMGVVMEKTRIAEDLLVALQRALSAVPGGLALAVTLMGTILAAATGIIGASVVMLTVLAVPTMLDRGYSPALAAGTVASAGTLGILIPPSIMLVFMGDLLTLNLAKLFVAAFLPGLALAATYLVFLVARAALRPQDAPAAPAREGGRSPGSGASWPWPSPCHRSSSWPCWARSSAAWRRPRRPRAWAPSRPSPWGSRAGGCRCRCWATRWTARCATLAMLFFIFVGATAFSYVFRQVGGEAFIVDTARALPFGDWGLLASMMGMVFVMGFFFDWIEITLILLPIFSPIVGLLDLGEHVARGDMIYWFAVLMAVNLQTSFLTPPFGFALFYLKGAAGDRLSMAQIYRGIIPFVALQICVLALLVWQPGIVTWLPNRLLD